MSMERWKADLIDRIIREDGRILGSYGLAIRLQQQLGMSWAEATSLANPSLTSSYVPESRWSEWRTDRVANTEISLEAEHNRQAKKMARLFAVKLSMSEEEYINTLPLFPDKPSPSVNPGLKPLIVEGRRIQWKDQARLSGIRVSFQSFGDVVDWDKDPQGFITPEKPFTTWVSIGDKINRYTGEDGRLAPENRGGNIFEGIAYWNAYSKLTTNGLFSLPGSRINKVKFYDEAIPYLDCQFSRFDAVLRSYTVKEYGFKPICHTLVSTRDIRPYN